MTIILSTRNPSKAEQIKAIFADLPIEVLTLSEAGVAGEAVEDGSTLEENATKKAEFAHKSGAWSMADDTGLFINSLNGKPGIYAARWAGENATPEETVRHTLAHLEDKSDRSATFRTVVVLISPTGEKQAFVGEVEGGLLESPRVAPQPKMPYSALFVPKGSSQVWAEMGVEEENAISHRGKAFRQVREYLLGLDKNQKGD